MTDALERLGAVLDGLTFRADESSHEKWVVAFDAYDRLDKQALLREFLALARAVDVALDQWGPELTAEERAYNALWNAQAGVEAAIEAGLPDADR